MCSFAPSLEAHQAISQALPMSAAMMPTAASGTTTRGIKRGRKHSRNLHLEEEEMRKAQLLASKQSCKRQLLAANSAYQQERRTEARLVKKAAKYNLNVFVKICSKKADLPFIVCSRCNCPIDSRRAIPKAVDEVAAGRPAHLQDAGVALFNGAAAQEAAPSVLDPSPTGQRCSTAVDTQVD